MSALHLLIIGKVQRVFYRASAKEVADRLQLAGWVKNTPAGDVEAIVEGSQECVNEFAEWCKTGSSTARVDQVIMTVQTEASLVGFKVIR